MRSSTWILVFVLVLLLAWFLVPPVIRRVSYSITRGQTQAWREQLEGAPAHDPMSSLFTQVALAVEPAVVEVKVIRQVALERRDSPDFLRRFFGDGTGLPQPAPREYTQRGIGSGFVVDAESGFVLTNDHVISGADAVQVVLADGRSLRTTWIRSDPPTDLALLKIDAADLIAIPLGDSDQTRVGDWVLAVGAPEGLTKTVTAGIISAKGRFAGMGETYQNFLQTDAAINPGNSGGPLVNMRAEVIGINTAIVSPTGAYAGIGFAIPSQMARWVMTQLIEQGRITRGFLGVSVQAATPELAQSFNLPDTKGALVTEVVPGSPAAAAGLQPGDFIVHIAGRPIDSPNDLRNTTAAIEPGKAVTVEFYREGSRQSVEATIAPQPGVGGPAEPAPDAGPAARLGLELAPLTPQLARQLGYRRLPQAVVITAVVPGSPADRAGLSPGLAITAVGDTPVTTPEDFEQTASRQADRGLRLRVVDPSGRSTYLFLAPAG